MSNDQTNTIPKTIASVPSPADFKAAYEYLRQTLEQKPESELDQYPVEGELVVQTLLKVSKDIEEHREAILLECPRLPSSTFTDFRLATFALGHAEALKSGASGLPPDGEDPMQSVRDTRLTMKADLEPLVVRGYLAKDALLLSQGNSPRAVAFDVLRLATYLDKYATLLQGRMWTTPEEVHKAQTTAQQLLQFASEKEGVGAEGEASLMYLRAINHVAEVYEELRWALRYTRRKVGDADTIAPSIYAMRAPRGPAAKRPPAQGSSSNPASAPSPTKEEVPGVDMDHLQSVMNSSTRPSGVVPSPSAATPATATSDAAPRATSFETTAETKTKTA